MADTLVFKSLISGEAPGNAQRRLFCASKIFISFVTKPGSDISSTSPAFEYGAFVSLVALYKTP